VTVDVFLAGIDHLAAPLEVRERLAVPAERVPDVLRAVAAEGWAAEAMLLSTCNRTELYVVTSAPDGSDRARLSLVRHVPGAPPPESGVWRERAGDAAAEHLFRVAAGLESALLGETEIQGQVRAAHAQARGAGTCGNVLDRLVRGAVHAGKRVRTHTAIAAGGISHGSAAVEVASRVFGSLDGREVLVIGAGSMAAQAARASAAAGRARIVVANRSQERGEALAATLPDGRAVGLDALDERLATAHVVVLAAEGVALARDRVERALSRRRQPLLVVDLVVPRAADPAIAHLPGTFLYDVEALEALVASALAVRRESVPAAETILAGEFSRWRTWRRTLGALPAIRSLHEWAEEVRRAALAELPPDTPEATRGAVDEMTRRLVKRILGRPAARVVEGAEREDPRLPTPEHLRSLFGLEEEAR
jgi:glutamyl-tRNA reductase